MRKRLTESQFQDAIQGLEIGNQTLEIARGVLVEGKTQAFFAEKFNITRGAVSQAVSRVYSKANVLPSGFEKVTAILPKHRAFVVKKWEAEYKKRSNK